MCRFCVTDGVPRRSFVVALVVGTILNLKGLMKADLQNALKHQDVFRALCLLRSGDLDTVSLAHSWLRGFVPIFRQ
jgi:hypothetical protein